MSLSRSLFFTVFLTVVLLTTGCLSESNSTTAGIEGTGSPTTVTGSVTAYGSVYVNGVHISVSDADIYVDGELATETDLKLGMVVEVETEEEAEEGRAVAQTVRYQRSLRGRVADVLEASDVRKVMLVLGQSLVVYDDAVFEGLTFEALEAGTAVEVSGFTDVEGRLFAARVASTKNDSPDVRGDLTQLDRARSRFELGELTVDFTDSLFESGARDQLDDGVEVRLRGGEVRDAVFYPEHVGIDDEDTLDEDEGNASREGVIHGYDSLAEFQVNDLTVNASSATITGGESTDVEAGVRVIVEGELEGGKLQAERLRLVLPGVDRVRAGIDAIDPESGELVLFGKTYAVSEVTAYEDRARGNRYIDVEDLQVGDYVEVHARTLGDMRTITRLKRIESDDEVELRGPATNIDQVASSLRVMGVEVFVNANDTNILDELQPGDRVQVQGRLSSTGATGAIQASSISFSSLPPGLSQCPPPFQPECDDFPGARAGQKQEPQHDAGFVPDSSGGPSFHF